MLRFGGSRIKVIDPISDVPGETQFLQQQNEPVVRVDFPPAVTMAFHSQYATLIIS